MTKTDQPVRLAPDALHLTCGVALGGGNSVGLGYCDGDDEIATPYYYGKPCPMPAKIDADSLPELEGGGEWKTGGAWFGGILHRAEWIWYDAEQLQAGCVVSFLDSAVDAARELFRLSTMAERDEKKPSERPDYLSDFPEEFEQHPDAPARDLARRNRSEPRTQPRRPHPPA